MRGRSKRQEGSEPKKPAAMPDKLSQPFVAAMKSLKAEMLAKAEAEKIAAAEAKNRPAPPVRRPAPQSPSHASRTAPKRTVDPMGHYDYDDRAAFHQAFGDVRPIAQRKPSRRSGQVDAVTDAERRERERVAREVREADDAARARLGALVAGSVRFVVEREPDGTVTGRRSDANARVLDTVTGPKVAPTARLDLHGCDAATAARDVVRFVREDVMRSARIILIVHGKGLHSDGGVGVLGDVVLKALTESMVAPRVVAFASAAPRLGGLGALVVRLGPS